MEYIPGLLEIGFRSISGFLLYKMHFATTYLTAVNFKKASLLTQCTLYAVVLVYYIFFLGMYRKFTLTDKIYTNLWFGIALNLFLFLLYMGLFVMEDKYGEPTAPGHPDHLFPESAATSLNYILPTSPATTPASTTPTSTS